MAHLASSNWTLCFAERSGCQYSIVKTSSLQYHILHYNVNIANILDMVHQANWLLKSLFTNLPIERRYYVYIYIYVYSIHYNIIIHYYIWNSYLPNVHRSCLRTSLGVAPAASAVAAATFHGHGDWGCSIAMFDYWRVLTIVTRPPIWFQMEMSRNTWSEKIRKTSSSVNPTFNNLKNHQILMFRIRFPMENDHPTTNQIVCGVPNIHSQIPTK